MNVDQIRELIALMKENGIRELDWDGGDGKLRLVAQDVATYVAAPAASHAAPAHFVPSAAPHEHAEPVETGETILSPIVGTYYAAPAPEKPPFVGVGDTVNAETVVCIIEAMKVMNEIKAEKSGRIRRILVASGQAVEYGQPMFMLE